MASVEERVLVSSGSRPDNERRPRSNHLISRRKVREFLADHPDAKKDEIVFNRWCRIVEQSDWRAFADVKSTFGTADQVGHLVVFNVGGNKYRVIAGIQYKADKPAWVFIKFIGTHAEYDQLRL